MVTLPLLVCYLHISVSVTNALIRLWLRLCAVKVAILLRKPCQLIVKKTSTDQEKIALTTIPLFESE